MAIDYIYTLEVQAEDIPNVFYVGHSSNPTVREKQHRSASKTGHEEKYQFIREIESLGYNWTLNVIKEIPEDEYPMDYERWYVIDYTRKGYDLTNMKHGDAQKRKELAEQIDNIQIRNVNDVKRDRLQKEQAIKELKSEKLRLKILKETELSEIQAKIDKEDEIKLNAIALKKFKCMNYIMSQGVDYKDASDIINSIDTTMFEMENDLSESFLNRKIGYFNKCPKAFGRVKKRGRKNGKVS